MMLSVTSRKLQARPRAWSYTTMPCPSCGLFIIVDSHLNKQAREEGRCGDL